MSIPYTVFPAKGQPILTCCQRACPLGTDISTYLSLIAQGKLAEALEVVREVNPFPSVCGRVCDHPCEAACRRAESDQPVAIRALKRVLADHERRTRRGWPERLHPSREEQVAIIGSGPAGLTAASDLLRRGYAVTVFEALPRAGGMMRVGIPEYRLPHAVLDDEISYLTHLGVALRMNCALGRDFTLEDLRAGGYAAVIMATGAHGSRMLDIPGAEWPGVDGRHRLFAAGETRRAARRSASAWWSSAAATWPWTPRAPRCAWARSRSIFSAWSDANKCPHTTGKRVRRWMSASLSTVSGGHWKLSGEGETRKITFAACTALFNAAGRFAPMLRSPRTTAIEADVVLTSVGQYALFSHRPEDGLAITPRHLYQADPETLQTTLPWIFRRGGCGLRYGHGGESHCLRPPGGDRRP